MFNNGFIPDSFRESIIFPLLKKGDLSNVSNYRGISFLSCLYKLFSQLLLIRIRVWSTRNNIIHEAQAGFRKNYSTADHIFTLTSLIEAKISKPKGKVFAFFIDFSAAFDTINRNKLFFKLHSLGLSTKLINIIKEIYRVTKAKVWTKDGFTNSFTFSTGVRQGDLLSPDLFNFYINDLNDYIEIGGFLFEGVWIRILLYADDIVFVAENESILQKMINKLAVYCDTWDLKVNLEKSKIIVFRKRGKLKKSFEWFYKNEKIEVVKTYKYLGVLLSSSGSMTAHLQKQLSVAKIGLNSTYKSLFYARSLSLEPFFKFFDAVSRSIMCYAAQVWGYINYNEVEMLQRFFIKKLMWLPYNTPNYILLLESGRDPLFVYTLKLHWNYLLHILELPDHRYPKIMFNVGRLNNLKWFKSFHDLAVKHNMWQLFLPLNSSNFKRNITNLLSIVQEESRTDLLNQALLAQYHRWYKEIKPNFGIECYLKLELSLMEIRYIIKARADMLPLNCKLWFPNSNHKCTLCNLKEDETLFHFIAICPILNEFRWKYFKCKQLTENQFINVLLGNLGWKQLAYYVKNSLSYRNELTNEYNS